MHVKMQPPGSLAGGRPSAELAVLAAAFFAGLALELVKSVVEPLRLLGGSAGWPYIHWLAVASGVVLALLAGPSFRRWGVRTVVVAYAVASVALLGVPVALMQASQPSAFAVILWRTGVGYSGVALLWALQSEGSTNERSERLVPVTMAAIALGNLVGSLVAQRLDIGLLARLGVVAAATALAGAALVRSATAVQRPSGSAPPLPLTGASALRVLWTDRRLRAAAALVVTWGLLDAVLSAEQPCSVENWTPPCAAIRLGALRLGVLDVSHLAQLAVALPIALLLVRRSFRLAIVAGPLCAVAARWLAEVPAALDHPMVLRSLADGGQIVSSCALIVLLVSAGRDARYQGRLLLEAGGMSAGLLLWVPLWWVLPEVPAVSLIGGTLVAFLCVVVAMLVAPAAAGVGPRS